MRLGSRGSSSSRCRPLLPRPREGGVLAEEGLSDPRGDLPERLERFERRGLGCVDFDLEE